MASSAQCTMSYKPVHVYIQSLDTIIFNTVEHPIKGNVKNNFSCPRCTTLLYMASPRLGLVVEDKLSELSFTVFSTSEKRTPPIKDKNC